ncbi:MAG: recombination regulator RecX [Betaproteobacteria bacterium]|nr:recombination regulator RecX [Betaproteobacteria bacterium]MCL2886878.1 recombination regulator RecX [Betaproteobacteria bacterium]
MPDEVPRAGAAQLRQRALLLLTRREYCRAELRKKLAAEAESAEQLDAVLDALQDERLLSDPRYAAARVAARARRYGDARLRQELRQQGVGDEDIAAALPQGGDESGRCRAVWARKFGALPETAEERARQMRFLQYRGFSGEAIRRVMRGADSE